MTTTIPPVCPQCPWRTANHGKRSRGSFYTKRNLRRLWNQIRGGGKIQSCHLTDPSHPDHIEAGASPDAKVHECTGSIILVIREIDKLREIAQGEPVTPEHVELYLEQNPDGIKRRGMPYWLLQRIQFANDLLPGHESIPNAPQELVQSSEIGRLPQDEQIPTRPASE